VSHNCGGRLPLLSASLQLPPLLKRAATSFAAWWTEAQRVWTVCLRLLCNSIKTAIWTRAFCVWVQHANHSATEPPCSGSSRSIVLCYSSQSLAYMALAMWVESHHVSLMWWMDLGFHRPTLVLICWCVPLHKYCVLTCGAPWISSSLNICHGLHWLSVKSSHYLQTVSHYLENTSYHSASSLFLSWFHYLPSRYLHFDSTNLLARPSAITINFFSHTFLSLHHLSGTLYLYTFVLSTSYQPLNVNWNPISSNLLLPSSHPVPAPQIHFTILVLYKLVYDDRVPELMTKSYHDHYQDMPWLDGRMRMMHASAETDWRHGAVLAAQVNCQSLASIYNVKL